MSFTEIPQGTYVTQRRLRTLTIRALEVALRHAGDVPAIAEVAHTAVPVWETYNGAYDALAARRRAQEECVARSHRSAELLHRELREKQAVLAHNAPDFDTRHLNANVGTADGLVVAGAKLVEMLSAPSSDTPSRLAMIATLRETLDVATVDAAQARAARVAVQEEQARVRELATEAARAISGFRRVVRLTLGNNHLDYQGLRVVRRAAATDDELVVDESEIETSADAAAGISQNGAAVNGAAANGVAAS